MTLADNVVDSFRTTNDMGKAYGLMPAYDVVCHDTMCFLRWVSVDRRFRFLGSKSYLAEQDSIPGDPLENKHVGLVLRL